MAAEAAKQADAERSRLVDQDPTASEIACRKGCSYCCHMRTLASPPVVLLLAQHLRDSRDEAALEAFIVHLERTRELANGQTDESHGRARITCALLEDDACIAYDSRPLECRGYTSLDVDACKAGYDDYDKWDVPVYLHHYSVFKNTQAGLIMACVGAGLSHEILELNTALHIALVVDDAPERWLSGEDIFREAALPETDPASAALQPWTPSF